MRPIWTLTVGVGASCLLVALLASLCLAQAHSQSSSAGHPIIRGDIIHKRSMHPKSAINYDQFLSRRTSGARALKSVRKLRKSSGARSLSAGGRRRFRGSRARSMRRLTKRFSNHDDEFLAYTDDREFLDAPRPAHKSQARAALGDVLPAVSLQTQAQQQQQQEGGVCKCAEQQQQQQQQQSIEVPKVGGKLADGAGQLVSSAKHASPVSVPSITTNEQRQREAVQLPVIGGEAQLPLVGQQQQQQQQQQSTGSDEGAEQQQQQQQKASLELPSGLKLGKVDGARGSSPLDSVKHAVEAPKVASQQQLAQASENTPSLFAATPSNLAGQTQKLAGSGEQKQQQVELSPLGGVKLQEQVQQVKPAVGEAVEGAVQEVRHGADPGQEQQQQQQQQVNLSPLGGVKLQEQQQQERSGADSKQQQQQQQQLDLGPLGGVQLQEQQQGEGAAGGQQQQQQTEVGPAGVQQQEQQQEQQTAEVPKLVIKEGAGRTQAGGLLKKVIAQKEAKEAAHKLKADVNPIEAKAPVQGNEWEHEPQKSEHGAHHRHEPQKSEHGAHHKHEPQKSEHGAHHRHEPHGAEHDAKPAHHVHPKQEHEPYSGEHDAHPVHHKHQPHLHHSSGQAQGSPVGYKQSKLTPHCSSSLFELRDVINEVVALIEHVGQHVLSDESVDYPARDALSRKLAKIRVAAEESRMAATLAQLKRLNESARTAGVELLRLAKGPAVSRVEPSLRPLALKMRQLYVAYRKACKSSLGSSH